MLSCAGKYSRTDVNLIRILLFKICQRASSTDIKWLFPKKHHRVSFASRPHAELTLLICYWRWAMWSANWQASNTSNRCTNSDTITWTVHRRHWLSLDMCLFCYYLSNKLCLIGHLFSKKSRVDWPVIDAKKFTMNRSLTIKFDLENCINFFVEIQCKFANAWYKFCGLSKFT